MSDSKHATRDLAHMPKEHNFITTAVAKRAKVLQTFVQGINPNQFVAACMLEANALSLSLTDREVADPRTVASFVKACFNAAVIGLLPGEAQGHLYFVPFNRGRKNDPQRHKLINVIVGYRGYLELAFRSDFLARVSPEYVLTGETVERCHDQNGPQIKHTMQCPGRPIPEKSNIEAAYLSYETRGGAKDIVFVEKWDLAKSEANGGDVWKYNYPAMALKTAIVRGSKRWRLTQQMAAAVMLDEQASRDQDQAALVPEAEATESGDEPVDFDQLVEADGNGEAAEGEDNLQGSANDHADASPS